jgi:hypothetical protein
MKRTLLGVALSAMAGACWAQTPALVELGTIPSWVKLDGAALAEDRVAESEEQVQLATLTRELNIAHPVATADRYPGHRSHFGPVDAYRYDERPLNPQMPKATDTPPPTLARPSVEAAGWKVSMPSIRAHAARLLLQRSF